MKKQAYGPFAYVPIGDRPPLIWPNGARVALWVIPNIEFFALDDNVARGGNPQPHVPDWSIRDYGNRIGVFRLMDVMDRYGIRGTVALNSQVCEHHPAIIEAGEQRHWEWMGHNETNTRRLNAVPAEEERGLIDRTLATITHATGARPAGWLSSGLQETWNSLDHFAAAGLEYVADWVNDDQPYFFELESRKQLVSVPYSWQINDKNAFDTEHRTADEFREMICRQFDVLYREAATSGRVMAIALHPYLIGLPFRIGALDAALEYICRHEGVWLATGSEIARHFVQATAGAGSLV